MVVSSAKTTSPETAVQRGSVNRRTHRPLHSRWIRSHLESFEAGAVLFRELAGRLVPAPPENDEDAVLDGNALSPEPVPPSNGPIPEVLGGPSTRIGERHTVGVTTALFPAG